MSTLQRKIDFTVFVSVKNANSNGDPLNGNRPRCDYNGFGEMSDVCIKRKIRNRMQDMGNAIFVQSDDRCDDGKATLKDRASDLLKGVKVQKEFTDIATSTWMDVRTFGQVFAFDSFGCKSVGVRGPVSIQHAVSVDPVEIESMQITKSVSGDKKEGKERGSDTMGTKHFVRFGLYRINGAINVQLAEKTHFTEEDAETVLECLKTLFVNDASAARPDGSMEVIKVFWWEHSCKDGQYSSAKVHRSVRATRKNGITVPTSADDYDISYNDAEVPGLSCRIFDNL